MNRTGKDTECLGVGKRARVCANPGLSTQPEQVLGRTAKVRKGRLRTQLPHLVSILGS